MLRLVSLTFMMVVLSFNAAATERTSVTATIDHFMHGASINDARIHDDFWAEELTYTSSSGERFGKAELMADMTDAVVLEPPLEQWYTAENYEVKALTDDLVVVNFTLVLHDRESNSVQQTYLNSGVMIWRDDRWQALNWNATRSAPATP